MERWEAYGACREAITSRPWLMSSVGCRTEHAGQTRITLTGIHACFEQAQAVLMRVSARLQGGRKETAEQVKTAGVWLRGREKIKRAVTGVATSLPLESPTQTTEEFG